MNILLVSTLRRRLGSDVTASRSRVIYNLAQGLIKRGHQVSIIAPENSVVEGATIIPFIDKSLSEFSPFENPFYAETAYLVALARKIQEVASDYDIVHNHTYPEFTNLLVEEHLPIPMVTTLHAPVTPELEKVLSFFPESNIVAQSQAYQALVHTMKIKWVVHNGVDHSFFTFSDKPRDYLLWVGRLGKSKDAEGNFIDGKGVRDAITVAQQTGKKLFLLANIEDQAFYEKDVAPHLSDSIRWVSPHSKEQIDSQEEVRNLMQGAKALLFPTKFEEAFGLVVAEAMACGTPVIAYARGSVTDIVEDGTTGFLVDSTIENMVQTTHKIFNMSDNDYVSMQLAARKRVEENFTVEKMVENYELLYKKFTSQK